MYGQAELYSSRIFHLTGLVALAYIPSSGFRSFKRLEEVSRKSKSADCFRISSRRQYFKREPEADLAADGLLLKLTY
jgi:hypothetical protein